MKEQEKLVRKYPFQLTRWLKREDLDDIILQIESYEGENKGYCVRERDGKWAVFTKGDLVVERKTDMPDPDMEGATFTIPQYRNLTGEMK